MQPLAFEPLIHRAIWGGQKLSQLLGKSTQNLLDAAESWEICDFPDNQSVVIRGPYVGTTLHELMTTHRQELLGKHAQDHSEFPLLLKYLDAQHQLSVQVHPSSPTLHSDGVIRVGKSEAWIVLDSQPESQMALGLLPEIGEAELRQAIKDKSVAGCLHRYCPQPGDCIYLEAGTVHALGGGILVAEIQLRSDITYRLYDWDRVDDQGHSRELHIEQGIASTNFDIGPVLPVQPRPLPTRHGSELLVETPHFVIQRHSGSDDWLLASDDQMHALMIVNGSCQFQLEDGQIQILRKGETLIIPAEREEILFTMSEDVVILDSFLP